ncbi:MAG: (Fe-S)-binding protein [Desulfocapsaceae bacterium]|nr:(Fe-S)-binding protein [Desulfocapsaceae bacterium]
MNACAKCGACSVVCPVYRVTGQEAHTARGKIHLTQIPELHGKGTVFEDIFSKCLLCGACSAVCPRGIDVCREVVDARAAFPSVYGAHGFEKYLARKALVHPETLSALRVLGRVGAEFLSRYLPADSGLRLRLALFQQDVGAMPVLPVQKNTFPDDLRPKEQLTYFPGCAARYLFPDIATSCYSLAAGLGYALHVPDGLSCCGLAGLSAGDRGEAQRHARKNIIALEQSPGPILVSCASCYAHLRRYGELFPDDQLWRSKAEALFARLLEFSCFLDQHLPPGLAKQAAGGKKVRVYYHDPCHFRQGPRIIEEPRQALGRNPDLELLELPDGPECCGQGGLFHIGAPDIAAVIRDTLAAKVLALRPDVITSTCSGCLMQWRLAVEVADSRVQVLHLAELLGAVTN